MKKKNKSILMYLAVTVFIVFTVFLYGPYSLYLPNSGDFWFTVFDITKVIIPVSAAAFVAIFVFLVILPEKPGHILCKVIMGIGLGLYIQGNFINISYGNGVMDGREIQWQWYTKYGLVDTLVWIICLVLPFAIEYILAKKGKGASFRNVIIAISCFLTAVQIPAFATQIISFHPESKNEISVTTDGEFELATDKNIVVFVMDTMDEAYFQEFLEANPDYTEHLNGFVHYDNTLSSGARTIIGFPSMFSGIPFTKSELYSEYKDKIWSEYSPLKMLASEGYDVGLYAATILYSDVTAEYCSNVKKSKTQIGSWKAFAGKVYQLVSARFFPHYLKKYVWMDTSEFDDLQYKLNGYSLKNELFVSHFRDEGLTINSDMKKCVRVYHMRGAHEPFSIDSDGNKKEDATLQDTVSGCFNIVAEYIEDMRSQGVLDDSVVIITADHGDLHNAEHPVFLLKEENSEGELRTDHSPVSLFDLPIYLADKAGKTLNDQVYGQPIHSLSEDDIRERHMFENKTQSSQMVISEYVTEGDAGDEEALTLIHTYDNADERNIPYKLGDTLKFNADATGTRYITEGMRNNNGWATVLIGPRTTLVIPLESLPTKDNLDMYVELNPSTAVGTRFDLKVNGTEILSAAVEQALIDNGMRVLFPSSLVKDDKMLTIEFDFPDVTSERTKTLQLETLIIKETNEE